MRSEAFKTEEWALCQEEIPKRVLRAAEKECANDNTMEIDRPSRGICHLCGETVKAGKGYHYKWPAGMQVKCPNCGKTVVTYRTGSTSFWYAYFIDNLATIQRGKDGKSVFVREWHILRTPAGGFEGPEQLREVARYAFRGRHIAKWTKEHRGVFFDHVYYDTLKEWKMAREKKTWIYDDGFQMILPDRRQMRAITRGTSLEYASVHAYAEACEENKIDRNDLYYFERFIKERAFEKITKAGFWRLALMADYGTVNRKAETLEEALGVPKWILRLEKPAEWRDNELAKAQLLTKMWRAGAIRMQDVAGTFQTVPLEILKLLDKYRALKLQKVTRYLEKPKGNRAYDYVDYLKQAAELGFDMTDEQILYPKDLERAHARTIAGTRYKADPALRKKFEKAAKKLATLAWETAELLIRPAASQEELIYEGMQLHHCVGGYATRMATGETAIFLIREKSKPEKPFYTLELRKGEVVQCRTLQNDSYEENERVREFVNQWTAQIAAAE